MLPMQRIAAERRGKMSQADYTQFACMHYVVCYYATLSSEFVRMYVHSFVKPRISIHESVARSEYSNLHGNFR